MMNFRARLFVGFLVVSISHEVIEQSQVSSHVPRTLQCCQTPCGIQKTKHAQIFPCIRLRGGAEDATENAQGDSGTKTRRMFAYPWESLGNNEEPTDYYKVLGVSANATLDDLKTIYKSLVLASHPDRNSSEGSAERFVAIREAWELLSDPVARETYDAFMADRSDPKWLEEREAARVKQEEEAKRKAGWSFGSGNRFGYFPRPR